MMSLLKKYNWFICLACSLVWLIRYIRFEQTLWQLSGVFTFAILSALLFKKTKEDTASGIEIGRNNHNYVKEAYQEEE